MQTIAKQYARRYGTWAYARMAARIGLDFIDAYVGLFGRLPRR